MSESPPIVVHVSSTYKTGPSLLNDGQSRRTNSRKRRSGGSLPPSSGRYEWTGLEGLGPLVTCLTLTEPCLVAPGALRARDAKDRKRGFLRTRAVFLGFSGRSRHLDEGTLGRCLNVLGVAPDPKKSQEDRLTVRSSSVESDCIGLLARSYVRSFLLVVMACILRAMASTLVADGMV